MRAAGIRLLPLPVLVLVAAGCGGDDARPRDVLPSFPSVSSPASAPLAASARDRLGDTGAGGPDLVAGDLAEAGGALRVRIRLATPPTIGRRAVSGLVVGAYLLRRSDDTAPDAARVVLGAGGPAFRFGPWQGRSRPVEGRIDGTLVTITVASVPSGRYRYVQFYAESAGATDVLPDAAADDAGVLPID